MSLKERLYKHNVAILKDYGGIKTKLSIHNVLRNKGLDIEFEKRPRGTANDEKLDLNISRTKAKIFEYAFCNPFDYFGTFTIDGKKYDRYNLENYHKNVSQFIRDVNKKYKCSIKYLLVPEQHKDGAWHEHGFVYGIPQEQLRLFTLEEKLPNYIREKLIAGQIVYDWTLYRDRFGFCDFEPIRNKEAISKYITKYITKDLSSCITELNAHLYYSSKGLKTATEIKRGTMLVDIVPDFENEYVKVKWFDSNTSLNTLKNLID